MQTLIIEAYPSNLFHIKPIDSSLILAHSQKLSPLFLSDTQTKDH